MLSLPCAIASSDVMIIHLSLTSYLGYTSALADIDYLALGSSRCASVVCGLAGHSGVAMRWTESRGSPEFQAKQFIQKKIFFSVTAKITTSGYKTAVCVAWASCARG